MSFVGLLKYWVLSHNGKIIFFYDETWLIRKLSLDNLYLKTSAYNERLIGTKSTIYLGLSRSSQNQILVGPS